MTLKVKEHKPSTICWAGPESSFPYLKRSVLIMISEVNVTFLFNPITPLKGLHTIYLGGMYGIYESLCHNNTPSNTLTQGTIYMYSIVTKIQYIKRHFPYQPCEGPRSGSQWWPSSPYQWGLGWLRPCYAALIQPYRDPCWKRKKHTSPAWSGQTGCSGEDETKRSLHHEAVSRNRNWKSKKKQNKS